MKIGTKSVLFGAHCFLVHPWFVAAAWYKLYGFPWDPRLWVAFFVHDLGYWGKPNMDGPEGETHVEFGALVMHLFDWNFERKAIYRPTSLEIEVLRLQGWKQTNKPRHPWQPATFVSRSQKWLEFSLYHSRYYAKKFNAKPSRLCFADKLSFALTPAWLYLPLTTATGEINEYLKNAQKVNEHGWKPTNFDKKAWHKQLSEYMVKWVEEHKDGREDTWTNTERNEATPEGVLK